MEARARADDGLGQERGYPSPLRARTRRWRQGPRPGPSDHRERRHHGAAHEQVNRSGSARSVGSAGAPPAFGVIDLEGPRAPTSLPLENEPFGPSHFIASINV